MSGSCLVCGHDLCQCKAVACAWTQDEPDDDCWATTCGHAFVLNEGAPKMHGMAFCCFCGAALHEVPYVAPKDDDDD